MTAERTRYSYFLEPGHEGAPGAQRWLLVPINGLETLPDFLLGPAERIQNDLRAYLEESHRTWFTLPLTEVVAQRSALSDTGRAPAKEETAEPADDRLRSQFARQLAREHAFDVIVFPELVAENVMVHQGGVAAWHGVKRKQRIVRGEGAPPDLYSWGKNVALSLRMRVFTPQGVKRFESYGGLDLLYEARVVGNQYRMDVSADLITDPALIREGVRLALAPYLSVPETTAAGGS